MKETGTGNAGLVRVTTPLDLPLLPGIIDSLNDLYANQFRPDDLTSNATQDVAFYGGNGTEIAAIYNFVFPQALGTAGLIATGTGNIIVNTANSDPSATPVNVTGITEIAGSGHIDVLTNGFIVLTEEAGDLRVGTIESTADDVTLTAPAGLYDVAGSDDGIAKVIGVNITLTADTAGGGAGIGTPSNLLETDLLDGGHIGVLTASATGSIFVQEVQGDLRVNTVVSATLDVLLQTLDGSILDRRVNQAGPANVFAINIDLLANGGGLGEVGSDLFIDSSTAGLGSGRLYATATGGSIYLTEVTNELNVLGAAATGDMRLTVPDLATAGQDLNLLAGGSVLADPFTTYTGFITAGRQRAAPGRRQLHDLRPRRVTAGHDSLSTATSATRMQASAPRWTCAVPSPRAAGPPTVSLSSATSMTTCSRSTRPSWAARPSPSGATPPRRPGAPRQPSDGTDTFIVNQLQSMDYQSRASYSGPRHHHSPRQPRPRRPGRHRCLHDQHDRQPVRRPERLRHQRARHRGHRRRRRYADD